MGLAGSPKTHKRFSAYLNEGSTDKHKLYLRSRDLRPGKSFDERTESMPQEVQIHRNLLQMVKCSQSTYAIIQL